MKHLSTTPICSNGIFIYRLNIKDDLTLKFKEEKFTAIKGDHQFLCELSGDNLNILKKYENLNKEINKAVDAFLKEILMVKNINYRIFTSWLTKTKPNGFSNPHLHSNSWLSGVYYPKGDPGFTIKFFNDTVSQFATPPTEYNIFNSKSWIVTTEDNLLILFFSQLRHQIMPNRSPRDRFSLAFNILPKGKFGSGDSTFIF